MNKNIFRIPNINTLIFTIFTHISCTLTIFLTLNKFKKTYFEANNEEKVSRLMTTINRTQNSVGTNRRLLDLCCDFLHSSFDGCPLICPIYSSEHYKVDCLSARPQIYCLKGKAKSGTTWTEYLISELMDTSCKIGNSNRCKLKALNISEGERDKDAVYQLFWGDTDTNRVTLSAHDHPLSPSCFKHSNPDVTSYNIVVLRDPRDVMASLHFYTSKQGEFVRAHFAKVQISNQHRWMKQIQEAAQSIEASDSGALLLIRYEELNKRNPKVLRQIFDFLHLDCTFDVSSRKQNVTELFDLVYAKYSFEKLSALEESEGVIGSKRKGRSKKMRKGESFAFESYFKPSVLNMINNAMKEDSLLNSVFLSYYLKEKQTSMF